MRKILMGGCAAVAILAAGTLSAQSADMYRGLDPLASWGGFYGGIHLGYGDPNFKGQWHTCCTTGNRLNIGGMNMKGVLGGGHVGYNHQMGSFVFGVEADLSGGWMRERGTFTTTSAQWEGKVDLLSSVRARLGMAFDDVHIYATGGVAFVRSSFGAITSSDEPLQKVSLDTFGGVVGGGAEWKVTDRISLRGEVLYYIFNGKRHDLRDFGDGGTVGDFVKMNNVFTARIGASYHF